MATPARAFVPDTLPSLASSARRAAYLIYIYNNYIYFNKQQRQFPRHNDDIDHNTNINDFLNGDYDYITHGDIDHDYNAHTLGYIDIGIKGYHLGSLSSSRLRIMLQSDRPRRSCDSRHYRSDCGGVLEYITVSYIW